MKRIISLKKNPEYLLRRPQFSRQRLNISWKIVMGRGGLGLAGHTNKGAKFNFAGKMFEVTEGSPMQLNVC